MSTKLIMLKSTDGHSFEVEEKIVIQSQTIAHLVEDVGSDNIPAINVAGNTLALVIEYLKKHHVDDDDDDDTSDEELKKWDEHFMKTDLSTIGELIHAANYLCIKSLLDLTCQTIADMITGKTPDQIRAHFKIENDFTPEEEEALRMENQWAFE